RAFRLPAQCGPIWRRCRQWQEIALDRARCRPITYAFKLWHIISCLQPRIGSEKRGSDEQFFEECIGLRSCRARHWRPPVLLIGLQCWAKENICQIERATSNLDWRIKYEKFDLLGLTLRRITSQHVVRVCPRRLRSGQGGCLSLCSGGGR